MIIKINSIPLPPPVPSPREWAKEQATEIIIGALDALRDIIVELSFSVTLIGTGLCLLFWVVGWDKGKQWAGILVLANVIIKLLLG